MKRSKAIFVIEPVEDNGWKIVIDFTRFRKNGIPAAELLDQLKKSVHSSSY